MQFIKRIEDYAANFLKLDKNCKKLQEVAQHGTTILALKYRGGTVIAGDMRMVKGMMEISSENFEKIFQISGGDSLIAVAGVVAIALEVIKNLNLEIEYYEKMKERALSFEAKANLLSQILTKLLPLVMNEIAMVPILASKNKIYAFDELGSKWEVNFQTVGSGAILISADLEESWRPDLSRKEAVKIAANLLRKATKNPFTGPGIVIYAIEDKIRKLSSEEVKEIIGGES